MFDPTFNRFQSLKILAYADRLREIAAGGEPYPLDWHIYPSNLCNHTCSWCMFRQNGEQANHAVMLPVDVMFRAVEAAASTGAVLMHFSGGGEPLLNKAVPAAMFMAIDAGLSVALSTNGTLLTPEVAELADYIRVSLNAGTAKQHHATNHAGDPDRKGDWHQILANVKAALPHKRRDLGLGFVLDHENVWDIYPFCRQAAELGVDFVHIRPAFWYDGERDQATRDAMARAFEECEHARADFGERVQIYAITEKFDGFWTPRQYDQCRAVWTGVCLRATGDFAVCQDRMDLTFGHTPSWKDGASFEEVWHSEEHREVVAQIHAGGELDNCPRCVWNQRNRVIDEVFVKDSMRLAMV